MALGTGCSGKEGMVLRSRCFGRVLGRRQPSTWLLEFQIWWNFSQLTSITCSLCCVSAVIGHFLAWSTRQIFFQGEAHGQDITVRHRVSTAHAGTPDTALLSSHTRAIQVQMLILEVLKVQPFSNIACVWSLWWPHFHLWQTGPQKISPARSHTDLSGLMTLPLMCWATWGCCKTKSHRNLFSSQQVVGESKNHSLPHIQFPPTSRSLGENTQITLGLPTSTMNLFCLYTSLDLQDPGPSQTSSGCHHYPKVLSPVPSHL